MKKYIDSDAFLEHIRKDPLFDLVERYGLSGVIESFQAADVVSREEYAKLQEENTKLKNQVWSLKKKIKDMKSDASWEEDIRRGQVQGMW